MIMGRNQYIRKTYIIVASKGRQTGRPYVEMVPKTFLFPKGKLVIKPYLKLLMLIIHKNQFLIAALTAGLCSIENIQ